MNSPGRDLRPPAQGHRRPRRPDAPGRADRQGEPGERQGLRHVRRDAVVQSARSIIAAQPSMPTFIWNINPEMAGHLNIFGTQRRALLELHRPGPSRSSPSNTSSPRSRSWRTASTASSKQCADADKASFQKYPSAKVVFFDNELQFAQADLSADVSQLKAKGAQLVLTCIDEKESIILGKELVQQHINAVQVLPNAYDAAVHPTERPVPRGCVLDATVRSLRVPAAAPRRADDDDRGCTAMGSRSTS